MVAGPGCYGRRRREVKRGLDPQGVPAGDGDGTRSTCRSGLRRWSSSDDARHPNEVSIAELLTQCDSVEELHISDLSPIESSRKGSSRSTWVP